MRTEVFRVEVGEVGEAINAIGRDHQYTTLLLALVIDHRDWPFVVYDERDGLSLEQFVLDYWPVTRMSAVITEIMGARGQRELLLVLAIRFALSGEPLLDERLLKEGLFDALDVLTGISEPPPRVMKAAPKRAAPATPALTPPQPIAPSPTEVAQAPSTAPRDPLTGVPTEPVLAALPEIAPVSAKDTQADVPETHLATPEPASDQALPALQHGPTLQPKRIQLPLIAPANTGTIEPAPDSRLFSKRIVQVAGQLGLSRNDDPAEIISTARRVLLDWVSAKGIPVPANAYGGAPFEIDITRARHPVSVEAGADCWAMLFDTADSQAAHRVWRTEVVLVVEDGRALVGLGLMVIDPNGTDDVRHTSIPSVIGSLVETVGLFDAGRPMLTKAIQVETEGHIDELIAMLESPCRAVCVVVVACDEDNQRAIDPDMLAEKLAGVAHVVAIDQEGSWDLTRRYGKPLSVFGLSVRVYRPAFHPDYDPPSRHPLFVGERWLQSPLALRDRLKEIAAEETTFAGSEVVPAFHRVRRWIADYRIKEARREARLTATSQNDQFVQLAKENEELRKQSEAAVDLASETEAAKEEAIKAAQQRINDYQEMARQLKVRVAWLEARVSRFEADGSDAVRSDLALPESWDDIEAWVERRLGGRVRLLPQAVKAARASAFKEISFAYAVLEMLGDHYQPMRAIGSPEIRERFEARKAELHVNVSGVGNAINNHRTKDGYQAQWMGSRITLDMHVQGSSSRRQQSGFRLYFYYDEDEDVVVVGHMPVHLPNTKT